MVDMETVHEAVRLFQQELNATAPAIGRARDEVEAEVKAEAKAAAHQLSESQRWALLSAFNNDNTDWIHGNTINSLLRRGLIRWIDNGNAYENGRGGYITTPAGDALAQALERAA